MTSEETKKIVRIIAETRSFSDEETATAKLLALNLNSMLITNAINLLDQKQKDVDFLLRAFKNACDINTSLRHEFNLQKNTQLTGAI
jgi:hypothetical protein